MPSPPNPFENHLVDLRDASRAIVDAVQNAGKTRSVKTRAKISAAMKGRRLSEATRKKIGDAVRKAAERPVKRQFTDEHRARLSEALTGRKLSWAAREKLSKAMKGRRRSEATRRKISEALKGRGKPKPPLSSDMKRSLAMRASWFLKKTAAKHGGQIPAWLLDDPEVKAAYDQLTTRRRPGEGAVLPPRQT